MHIVECYFENGGFDHHLIKGGISIYIWNLSQQFHKAGHRVSILTASHGQLDFIRSRHGLEGLDYQNDYRFPLLLDPEVWTGFPEEIGIDLVTRAYRTTIDGIDLYFLSNEYLDLFPDTFYPPYESKGKDLGFYKPLIFQVDCARFIKTFLDGEDAVVHLHEPYYHFLLPAALKELPGKQVVSTVQSNMPINKKEYRPLVARLFELLGLEVDLGRFEDRLDPSDDLLACMQQYLPSTHLHYNYRPNHVCLYSLVLEYTDLVDFLSPGQRRFYCTFRDTPFERLFGELRVCEQVRRHAQKEFVGGCAISDHWLQAQPDPSDRAVTLEALGLDPALPTFFHNARYAPDHKGQVELIRAIERVLSAGPDANFIIRCISGSGIGDPLFHSVARRFSGNLYLDSSNISEDLLRRYAAAADFCLFPSKFEMDTFLIAQGEAMALGVVPIATAQEGMRHFQHGLPLADAEATGLAMNRSFHENDDLLVESLRERIQEAIGLFRDQPQVYERLAANARRVACQFTWDACARAHLVAFEGAANEPGSKIDEEEAIADGRFELLDQSALNQHRDRVLAAAQALGDYRTFRRCLPPDEAQTRRLFDTAFLRGDFETCEAIASELSEQALHRRLSERCRARRRDNATEISYVLPSARRIELFYRADEATGTATARFRHLDLVPENQAFVTSVNDLAEAKELFFMLTLDTGRVTWDRVAHA